MQAIIRAALTVTFVVAASSIAFSANVTVTDADTLVLDGVIYRLQGIVAPETDQICLRADGSVWSCGIEARDKVRDFLGTGAVKCEATGFDTKYRNRRIGRCTVDGTDLNEWIVKQGWAIDAGPYARGKFKPAEAEAKAAARGLWKGCFASPQSWRYSERRDAALFGNACKANDSEDRERLFPRNPAMPDGCSIKGRNALRARITGHVGIYYMEACRSYGSLKKIDRWFCTEQEAQAEGYRKAFNCRN
jgi:endonuclease YncB( thermonuclease family)